MRDIIDLIESFSVEVFERCQQGDTITASNGEAGYGVYAYPVKYASKLRPYYTQGANLNIFRFTLKTGYVVDLTDTRIMPALLDYAREKFARTKEQMSFYQNPKVNKGSIQRFGAIIEDFMRDHYADASGYTVSHEFGSAIPKGKQTVITNLDHFDITKVG